MGVVSQGRGPDTAAAEDVASEGKSPPLGRLRGVLAGLLEPAGRAADRPRPKSVPRILRRRSLSASFYEGTT